MAEKQNANENTNEIQKLESENWKMFRSIKSYEALIEQEWGKINENEAKLGTLIPQKTNKIGR